MQQEFAPADQKLPQHCGQKTTSATVNELWALFVAYSLFVLLGPVTFKKI